MCKKELEEALDIFTQATTFGAVGYDGDDGFGLGQAPQELIVDPIKDITGATAAEEANVQAQTRFDQEKAEAARQREEAKGRQTREQIGKSRLAGVARGQATTSKATGGQTNKQSSLGSDEQDFLGL